MTTNEPPLEKRIADEFSDDLWNPPVCPEEVLNDPGPVPVHGQSPQTQLLLGGIDPDEITADFLVDVHDLAADHELDLESASVKQPGFD